MRKSHQALRLEIVLLALLARAGLRQLILVILRIEKMGS